MAKRRAKSKNRPVRYHVGKFPPKQIDWSRLVPLIGPANAALARYDGLLSAIPNAEILLSPLTMREAVLSSRIEGTQATIGEVLEYEAARGQSAIEPGKASEIQEVLNYRKAMREAVNALEKLPLCGRVIRDAHRTLLSGSKVRGHDKARGEYRKIQNYIGRPGRPIEDARFVPIAPERVADAMSQLEKYMHSIVPDTLVQMAVIHGEFESLHPFLDGNGRVGRMLIPLFLFERELLHSPTFYVSEYLEQHRDEYYDRLLSISRDDDWTGWCEFFLSAVTEQAASNQQKAQQILDLYRTQKDLVVQTTRSQYSIAALDFLFDQPIFNSSDFIQKAGIPAPTGRRILRQLSEESMLRTLREARGQRSAIFVFTELLNIAEGRRVF